MNTFRQSIRIYLAATILERPLLLGSSCWSPILGVDDLGTLLSHQFRVLDLEPMGSSLRFEAAAASFGEVNLVSVLGTPLTVSLAPLRSFCTLALPSAGWGQYQMGSHRVDNAVGQTIAFIPATSWRLVNDATGGTAVQFSEESLISRILAISGCPLNAQLLRGLLAVPFAVATAEPGVNQLYHQLLQALELVDSSYRSGLGAPHPMLRLDDLVLRCVALLLYPPLLKREQDSTAVFSRYDLRRTVLELMEWMRAHLDQPLSLTEIEQRSHYGRRAIQLGFKAEVGCGPMQWLRRQRLELAYLKLSTPGAVQSVTEAAHACGYLNLAGFSRDFRQRFGVGARELLRDARRGQLP